jgi:lipopolysaccharide/colanic/teichoic acid biosynthesis glycosyltransferase
MPFVAAAIWLEDRGPVFYSQDRLGRDGRVFRLIKLRTMRADAEADGPSWATSDDERTTWVGRMLRRTKIDEFPQFINVLLGHMTLIGPRPERPVFVELLRAAVPHYDLRHTVRPGLTGWGTVKIGYGNSIQTKQLTHQYDMYHLRHRNLWFDLEILIRTIPCILDTDSDRFMT